MKNTLKTLYHKYNKNYQEENLLKKELLYFSDCEKILDVGCGVGEFVNIDSKRIMGLDHNKKSIAICKRNKLSAVVGEVTKMPFKDKSFDGVHCAHVIEHLLPAEAYIMLGEIGRILKKNGIFVLSTPILWEGFYSDFTHIKPYYPDSIRRYLCANGEQKNFDDFPFVFKEIDFYWRYSLLSLKSRVGYLLANYLYQFGLHSFRKDAYTLVLQKIC